MEEEYFFPMIEEYTGVKGIMETNVNQHAAFAAGVERFRIYVFQTRPETYDGKRLKDIVDGFWLSAKDPFDGRDRLVARVGQVWRR